MEHFVQATVRICRGAQSADKTVENVARVVHCLVCEERSVIPNSNHPVDASSVQCLACDCTNSSSSSSASNSSTASPQRGRNRILLGPVWCGKIFDSEFVAKMEKISSREGDEKIAVCAKTKEILSLLKAEAVCSSLASSPTSTSTQEDGGAEKTEEESTAKRRRLSGAICQEIETLATSSSESITNEACASGSSGGRMFSDGLREELCEGEPLFYYSTHLHVPKGSLS